MKYFLFVEPLLILAVIAMAVLATVVVALAIRGKFNGQKNNEDAKESDSGNNGAFNTVGKIYHAAEKIMDNAVEGYSDYQDKIDQNNAKKKTDRLNRFLDSYNEKRGLF